MEDSQTKPDNSLQRNTTNRDTSKSKKKVIFEEDYQNKLPNPSVGESYLLANNEDDEE